jgi:hypothetical protein
LLKENNDRPLWISVWRGANTPSWLSLIPNGLNDPEHPEYGGWGGRYEHCIPEFDPAQKGGSGVPSLPETRDIWTNAPDRYSPYLQNEYGRTVRRDTLVFSTNQATLWHWRDDFQSDFAARMDWCLESFQEVNHPLVPAIVSQQIIENKITRRGAFVPPEIVAAKDFMDRLAAFPINYSVTMEEG